MYQVFVEPERHTINCANCKDSHNTPEGVRRCFAGDTVGTCSDLFPTGEFTEDGEQVVTSCVGDAFHDERGVTCTRGHSYVNTETRMHEGWDYAADAGEAELLRKYGRDAVSMRGDSI